MSENLRAYAQNGAALRGEGREMCRGEVMLDLDGLERAYTCHCWRAEAGDECMCDANDHVVAAVRELRKLREENARLEDVILDRNAEIARISCDQQEKLTAQIQALVDMNNARQWIAPSADPHIGGGGEVSELRLDGTSVAPRTTYHSGRVPMQSISVPVQSISVPMQSISGDREFLRYAISHGGNTMTSKRHEPECAPTALRSPLR